MKFSKTLIYYLLILIITSCSTLRVKNYGPKIENVKSIALVSTMIGRIQQPLFPLIDAAAFNEKTNFIADEIMDLQKKKIDYYQEVVAVCLQNNYNCNVLFDTALTRIEEFYNLKSQISNPKNLLIDNRNFPLIISATNDYCPFQFDNGKVVKYFEEPSNYKAVLTKMGIALKTDLIAVSFTQLTVTGVSAFGMYGALRIDTYIYLFNQKGDLISEGHSWSKPINIEGDDIDDYEEQLNNFSLILKPLIIKMVNEI